MIMRIYQAMSLLNDISHFWPVLNNLEIDYWNKHLDYNWPITILINQQSWALAVISHFFYNEKFYF